MPVYWAQTPNTKARLHARVKLCSLDPLAYPKKNRPIPSGGVVFDGN